MLTSPAVLLVDDHAMFRSGLAMLLRLGLPHLQLMEAGALEEALAVAEVPDLVLLDIKLQGLSGLDCMPVFQRKWPRAALAIRVAPATDCQWPPPGKPPRGDSGRGTPAWAPGP